MRKLTMLFSLASICLAAAPLNAQQQCTPDQQVALDTCIGSATSGCSSSYPSCNVRQVQLQDVVNTLQRRCIFKRNGQPRPVGACRACLNAVIVDLRAGPSRYLWPAFTTIVSAELNRLRQDCGSPATGGSSSSAGKGNKLCDRFPNLPKCKSSSSSSSSSLLTSSSSSSSASSSSVSTSSSSS